METDFIQPFRKAANDSREEIWGSLYDQLDAYLAPLETNSCGKKADYFLLAEDWGGSTATVTFRNFSLVNARLFEDFRKILKEHAPNFYIMVYFDTFLDNGSGFDIFADRVVCMCNLKDLRKAIRDPNFCSWFTP